MFLHLLFGLIVKSTDAVKSAAQKCASHFVAEDPYPYAEVPSDDLIEYYRVWLKPKIREELEFRRKNWMLTERQVERLEEIIRGIEK